VKEVLIDKKPHAGNIIPVFEKGTEHNVKVTLG